MCTKDVLELNLTIDTDNLIGGILQVVSLIRPEWPVDKICHKVSRIIDAY